MICTACKSEIPEAAKVCGYCGTKVAQPEARPPGQKPTHRRIWVGLGIAVLVALGCTTLAAVGWMAASGFGSASGLESRTATDPQSLHPDQSAEDESAASTAPDPEADAGRSPVNPTPMPDFEEPLQIYWRAGEIEVPAEVPITVYVGWTATDPELVADYVNSVRFSVSLDGDPLAKESEQWSDTRELDRDDDGDGQNDYFVRWDYPLGSLDPGRHAVVVTQGFAQAVRDGFDLDDDGELDVYSQPETVELVLIVE